MSNDLIKRYSQDMQRFRYFMVAGAAACLAYALSRDDATAGRTVADYLWLTSVLIWGVSFVSGLFSIERVNQATRSNINHNIAKGAALDETAEALEEQFDKNYEWAVRFYSLQKWALLAGAGIFGLSVIVTRFSLFA
jgi:hypothetical protein